MPPGTMDMAILLFKPHVKAFTLKTWILVCTASMIPPNLKKICLPLHSIWSSEIIFVEYIRYEGFYESWGDLEMRMQWFLPQGITFKKLHVCPLKTDSPFFLLYIFCIISKYQKRKKPCSNYQGCSSWCLVCCEVNVTYLTFGSRIHDSC